MACCDVWMAANGTEIQKMREERQMLGQMITQVHQQQNELKELQSQNCVTP
jgi:hypothetical protein